MLATYYRNNILHLFAMPSLLACCFVSNARMRTVDIQRLVWRVYPYIRAELCAALGGGGDRRRGRTRCSMRWRARAPAVRTRIAASGGVRRPTSLEAIQLSLLAEATIQTIERYYLVIALLLQAGAGAITPGGARGALPSRWRSACRCCTAWIRRSSSTRACSAISSICCAGAT